MNTLLKKIFKYLIIASAAIVTTGIFFHGEESTGIFDSIYHVAVPVLGFTYFFTLTFIILEYLTVEKSSSVVEINVPREESTDV